MPPQDESSLRQVRQLQEYIDELTVEKLQLERLLQQQCRLNDTLGEEGEQLVERHNEQSKAVEALGWVLHTGNCVLGLVRAAGP